ncbi:MAG: hypothetical protein EOP01_11250 [Propionibacteriaceae bacterium]|nr:MAG: hypothetical protein EOP01_11250 [Propionibacteriaceae bacterium]
MAAYAGGRSGPSDSWSLEAHLMDCAQCRAALALALEPADADLLATQRAAFVSAPPAQTRGTRRARRAAHWLVRPSALLVVLAVVVAATVLDATAPSGWPALWLLAPVVPALGVACAAWGENDPGREAVLATPAAGLRLTLWRTLVVVGTALPLTFLAGVLVGASGLEFRWLLPSLATSAASLALGTLLPLERAAAAVAGAWVLLVVLPSAPVLNSPWFATTATWEPAALSSAAQPLWLVVVLTAALVVALRRSAFSNLSTWRNR